MADNISQEMEVDSLSLMVGSAAANSGEPSTAQEAAPHASRRQKMKGKLRQVFKFKKTPSTPTSDIVITPGDQRQEIPITSSNVSKASNAPVLSPYGIKVWHDCPDAKVDVCFIHGLAGDREKTWTAEGQSQPWPQTLLPSLLGGARILTYGYDAYVIRGSSAAKNSLSNHALNLLKDLADDRASCEAPSRPVIFVAHSLGGLVCKGALMLSCSSCDAHLQSIFKATRGIAFMGTPHKGSWVANWAMVPILALGFIGKSVNKSLLNTLQEDNVPLEDDRKRFAIMLRESGSNGQNIGIACFCEELPLSNLGGIIVSQDSATLEGYRPFTIHADHRGMVRFQSAEDTGFKRLLEELHQWIPQENSRTEPGKNRELHALIDILLTVLSLSSTHCAI